MILLLVYRTSRPHVAVLVPVTSPEVGRRLWLDAARLMVLRAAWRKERGLAYGREAAMAKLFASESANRICNRCVQIHGGYGYVRDFAAERHLRDVRVTTIYEGTSEIQRTVIARSALR